MISLQEEEVIRGEEARTRKRSEETIARSLMMDAPTTDSGGDTHTVVNLSILRQI